MPDVFDISQYGVIARGFRYSCDRDAVAEFGSKALSELAPRHRVLHDVLPRLFRSRTVGQDALVTFLEFQRQFFDNLGFTRSRDIERRQVRAHIGSEVRHVRALRRPEAPPRIRSNSGAVPKGTCARQASACNTADGAVPLSRPNVRRSILCVPTGRGPDKGKRSERTLSLASSARFPFRFHNRVEVDLQAGQVPTIRRYPSFSRDHRL